MLKIAGLLTILLPGGFGNRHSDRKGSVPQGKRCECGRYLRPNEACSGPIYIKVRLDTAPCPFPVSAGQLWLEKLTEIDDMLRDIYNFKPSSNRLIITELRKLVALLKEEVYPQSSVVKEPVQISEIHPFLS